jgi:membrane protease YdiL (CAAX protease family)
VRHWRQLITILSDCQLFVHPIGHPWQGCLQALFDIRIDRPTQTFCFQENLVTNDGPLPAAPETGWKLAEVVVLGIACLLPTLVTLLYFEWAVESPSGTQQIIYTVAKLVQFSLPVAWVAWVERRSLRLLPLSGKGIAAGILLGVAIGGAMWGLYLLLAESPLMSQALVPIQQKIVQVGIGTVWRFAAVGAFYALFHSLLEEYYWRWFVFGRMGRLMPVGLATVISAIAFTLHHIIVLWHYFSHAPLVALLFSVGVGVGGALWAALYQRSGSLVGPWLSHLLVDAAIFSIGMHMVWPMLTAS